MTMAANQKPPVDWLAIEKAYRAGILSVRAVALDAGVTEAAIRKRAKRDLWTRDLSEQIRQRADELVLADAVRTPSTQLTPEMECELVEDGAELQRRVRRGHQQDIGRLRAVFANLLEMIRVASSEQGQALIRQLIESANPPVEGETEWAALRRTTRIKRKLESVLGLTSRVESAKKLTEMLEKLVRLEREAYGIKDEEAKTSEFEDLLAKVYAEMPRPAPH